MQTDDQQMVEKGEKNITAVMAMLDLKKDGKPRVTSDNFLTIMTEDAALAGKIRYNEFAQRPVRQGNLPWPTGRDGVWTDCDDAELKAYIHRIYGLRNDKMYEEALLRAQQMNRFHPVKERLEALPAWDGISRIGELFPKYLGAEKSDYTTAITQNWMLAAISRIYDPGCKYDYVLILIGEQGSGKSSILRKLSLEDEWFDDSIGSLSGKDSASRLQGKWIIELQELKALKREKDSESIKAYLTTQSDYLRKPYAKREENYPRQCVFAGTTNETFFLTDRTGNRRFLPLKVSGADADKLFTEEIKKYIEQCWAEGLAIYREAGGHLQLNLPREIEEQAKAKQVAHLEDDVRIGLMQAWLDNTEDEYVSIVEIWRDALHKEIDIIPTRKETNDLHQLMRCDIEGWQLAPSKHRTRHCSSPAKCYMRKPAEEDMSPATVSPEQLTWEGIDQNVPF